MKNEKIFLRVTKYEKNQLKQEAAKRGMTQSELIRSFIAQLRGVVWESPYLRFPRLISRR
ncbi:plasmid mobilization protein [Coleofasciculus sp. E1-EBD-02]|uniref:plasmid mobilization protein n=1 Tax=unclassified Coleofasciculus TaxID=2692782 RepID=UPI0032F43400